MQFDIIDYIKLSLTFTYIIVYLLPTTTVRLY